MCYNTYHAANGSHNFLGHLSEGAANRREQVDQAHEVNASDLAKQILLQLTKRLVKGRKQLPASRGDPRPGHSAILGIARAPHKPRILQPVQKSCDIWYFRYETLTNFVPAQRILPGSPQNAKHVVLGGGHAVRLEKFRQCPIEHRCRASDAEHRLLLGRLKWLLLLQFLRQLRGNQLSHPRAALIRSRRLLFR